MRLVCLQERCLDWIITEIALLIISLMTVYKKAILISNPCLSKLSVFLRFVCIVCPLSWMIDKTGRAVHVTHCRNAHSWANTSSASYLTSCFMSVRHQKTFQACQISIFMEFSTNKVNNWTCSDFNGARNALLIDLKGPTENVWSPLCQSPSSIVADRALEWVGGILFAGVVHPLKSWNGQTWD